MEYLTIREQKTLAGMKELYPKGVDFTIVSKSSIARQLNMQTSNFFRALKALLQKGHIKYENNIMTYK